MPSAPTRRVLLTGAASAFGLLAAGCSPTEPTGTTGVGPAGAGSSSSAKPPVPTAAPSAGSSIAPASPSATATTPAGPNPAGPTRAQIVAKYAGRTPREWGLQSSGTITQGSTAAAAHRRVALTFDACGGRGGKGYDADLIAALRRHSVPATLFLNARWIRENPTVAKNLAADPLFEIGSHGMRHVPLSVNGRSAYGARGTSDVGEVYDELTQGNPELERLTGHPVRWFRPGTAHCDEIAAAIARELGTPIVEFNVNGDAGTTFTPSQIVQALGALRPGGIVISHMNHPEHGTAEGYARALPRLLAAGHRFSQLHEMF